MTGRIAASTTIRIAAIVAVVGIGIAIALIAWQDRVVGHLAGGGYLRVAIALLLVSAAAMFLVAALLARALLPAGERAAAIEEPAGERTDENLSLTAGSDLPVPLARIGHLMSIGSLIRGFCHELNNELGPVQGYSELLCGDTRLSELHRRQIARIRDATKNALADIRGFGSALSWSDDPADITRLGAMVEDAARSAQAAITTKIELDLPAGADVEVTATEAEVGQAILHLCAAAVPLLGAQDAHVRIRVDSIVGATSTATEDLAIGGHRLEIWSDPLDPERTKVQFGALRPSWRYGRVRLDFRGHGWHRDVAGKMFDLAHAAETPEVAAMALLGTLMIESGGVIMLDTCPNKQTAVTLLWPARISPQIAAPLELDTREDELDALVIHASEVMAEELSRRLTAFGLRVASTSSADAAMELVVEMGARCRAVVLTQPPGDGEIARRLREGETRTRIYRFEAVPEAAELERLAAELRRPESVR